MTAARQRHDTLAIGHMFLLRHLLPALVMVPWLAGCGTPATVSGVPGAGGYLAGYPSYSVGPPYQVGGVWYYPAVDYNYDRTGIASWYGAKFQGRYTANGEVFDLNALTAAHTTLPLPSVVQVTNLENGRSIRLRVNDRGPFVGGRLIDVTRRAAQLLGFEGAGTARVDVKVLKRASIQVAELAMRHQGGGIGEGGEVLLADAAPSPAAAPPPAPIQTPPPPPVVQAAAPPVAARFATVPQPYLTAPTPQVDRIVPSYALPAPRSGEAPPSRPRPVLLASAAGSGHHLFIQAGAFAVRDNAWRVRARIAPLGSVEVMTASINGVEVYRVRLGPFASLAAADALLARVVDRGYPGARIVTD